jgi:hypothetical protein
LSFLSKEIISNIYLWRLKTSNGFLENFPPSRLLLSYLWWPSCLWRIIELSWASIHTFAAYSFQGISLRITLRITLLLRKQLSGVMTRKLTTQNNDPWHTDTQKIILGIMAFSMPSLSIMTLGITSLKIIMTLPQHNNTQRDNIQHDVTEHNVTQPNKKAPNLSWPYTERRYSVRHFAECRGTKTSVRLIKLRYWSHQYSHPILTLQACKILAA